MSKYKMCEKVGLKVVKRLNEQRISKAMNYVEEEVVLASDVEALLEGGVEVFGPQDLSKGVSSSQYKHDEYSGIVIRYSKLAIPRPVTKEEIDGLLNHSITNEQNLENILKRILTDGYSNE